MICRLCQKDKVLVKSHIIPKFVSRWLKETSATGYVRKVTKPNLRKQDFSTEQLLCRGCENIFSQCENQFAQNIFYPYLSDEKNEFEYDEWLLKFAVSLIWRLGIVELNRFRDYKPQLTNDVEHALSIWREYLLNNAPMKEQFGFHLFFFSYVQKANNISLPEGFHWYTLRATDATLPASESEVYGYVKLPALIFFSGIKPKLPTELTNTFIHEHGKFNVSTQKVHNDVFGDFYLDRVQQAWDRGLTISEKQQMIIQETMERNPEKTLKSESFQVFLAEKYWKPKDKLNNHNKI